MRYRRAERVWMAWVLVAVGSCGPGVVTTPPTPGGRPADLVRRHWDQACSTHEREPVFAEVAELFDTVGLARELNAVRLVPRPLAPPWPVVDFITRYGVDGRPARMGTWEPTTQPDVSAQVEQYLSERVRPLPGLLAPTGFRTRVVFAPRPRFETAGPVVCLPHMVHERGKRATGLPDTVRTWGGNAAVIEGELVQTFRFRRTRSGGGSGRSPQEA